MRFLMFLLTVWPGREINLGSRRTSAPGMNDLSLSLVTFPVILWLHHGISIARAYLLGFNLQLWAFDSSLSGFLFQSLAVEHGDLFAILLQR